MERRSARRRGRGPASAGGTAAPDPGGATAVASAEGGYRLAAAPDDVDLHRFERLADEGARSLADGDAARAAVLLDDALALWHGPALADLPDGTVEAARCAARRLDARRARLAAALALGRAGQALPELTAVCESHPSTKPSRRCGCAPCATRAAPPRHWPPTRTCAGCSPTGWAPTRAPSCAPCTPTC
ncbi:hypothetical protein GCM10020295_60030 [Streptomyces cinereospinus]